MGANDHHRQELSRERRFAYVGGPSGSYGGHLWRALDRFLPDADTGH
jgi:hypothetical protein